MPTSAVFMWDIKTSACPFHHRNLTLNLERSVQALLTSQDYKKLLNVRSRCCPLCFPCCVSLPCSVSACVSICAHTVSRSASRAVSPCPTLRPPVSQCAPGLTDVSCKRRWVNIRDPFKKSLKRRKTKSGQAADSNVKKYKYEEVLLFLMPHIHERSTISSTEQPS
jgi:hypothetical protein